MAALVASCTALGVVRLPLGRRLYPLHRDNATGIAWLRRPGHRVPLRGSAQGAHRVPLRGNWTALALWYMTLDIGSARQTFHVVRELHSLRSLRLTRRLQQVDTGSSDLGVPDVTCGRCGRHKDAPWSPLKDPWASPAGCSEGPLSCSGDLGGQCVDSQCGYTITYEDNTGYSALLYNDSVVFGPVDSGIPLRSQFVGSITKVEERRSRAVVIADCK